MKFQVYLIFVKIIASSIAIAPVQSQEQTKQGFSAPAVVEIIVKQKEQLVQLLKNTRSQIQAILTIEQQDKLKIVMEIN